MAANPQMQAIKQVLTVLNFAVLHPTPETQLVMAIVRQALFDAYERRHGADVRSQIARGCLNGWLEVAGIEPDYFLRVCRDAGLHFDARVAA